MNARNLLIIGRSTTNPPARYPTADEAWTTLACVNDNPDLLQLHNLKVWDCHPDQPNPHNVKITFDIRRDHVFASELIAQYGPTFANQLCWMLAHASERGDYAAITLVGCNFNDDEYQHELQYVAYHIGMCRMSGIAVIITPPSALLRPFIYGRTK